MIVLHPWSSLSAILLEQIQAIKDPVLMILDDSENTRTTAEISISGNVTILNTRTSVRGSGTAHSPFAGLVLDDLNCVVNCSAHDFLKIRVDGQGSDWAIDHSSPEVYHLAVINQLLAVLPGQTKMDWINVVYGQGGKAGETEIFCDSRYAVMGLHNIIQLNPRYSNIRVRDLCLTYLRQKDIPGCTLHCQHCTAEKYPDDILHLKTVEDIAAFLIQQYQSK